MTEMRTLSMTLRPGDMVLVIGIDEDAPPEWPRPGAIGQIKTICWCQVMTKFNEAYKVRFTGNREGCYRRPQLKKLEPPPESVTDSIDVPREVTV